MLHPPSEVLCPPPSETLLPLPPSETLLLPPPSETLLPPPPSEILLPLPPSETLNHPLQQCFAHLVRLSVKFVNNRLYCLSVEIRNYYLSG